MLDFGPRPVLTRQEEIEAWERKDHDLLIRSCIPLVLKIARTQCITRKYSGFEECVSAGLLALTDCVVNHYDATVARLTTYASLHIRRDVDTEITKGRKFLQNDPPSAGFNNNDSRRVVSTREGCRVDGEDSRFSYDPDAPCGPEIEELKAAVERLPKKRKVAIQGFLAGETCEQTASRYGLTRQAVSAQRIRGFNQLRGMLCPS